VAQFILILGTQSYLWNGWSKCCHILYTSR